MATTVTYKYLDYAGLQKFAQIINEKFTAVGNGTGVKVEWDNILDKPTTFNPAEHTHSYAGSSSAGGAATSALRLSNTTAIGSNTKPVYFSADGVPVEVSANLATQTSVDDLSKALDSKAPLANPVFSGTPTAPTANQGTNTTQIATTAYVKAEIDSVLQASDAMRFKGTIGTGGTIALLPVSHSVGDTYKVITDGTYAGIACTVGDMIICIKDSKDGTTASNSDWTVVQANIDGVVTGPSNSVNNRVAVFNGTTGKVIKDSGYTIETSVPKEALFSDTTYTFVGGANGSFTVTPKGGDTQTVSIGKPASAGTADNADKLDGHDSTYYATADSVVNLTNTVNGKAPTSHVAQNGTYGLGTTSVYGHVKLVSGDLKDITADTDGIAASQKHTHGQYVLTDNMCNLNFYMGAFQGPNTYDPDAKSSKFINIPTNTSHLTNDSNFITSSSIEDLDSSVTAGDPTTDTANLLVSVIQTDGKLTGGTYVSVTKIVATDITWDKLLA